MIIRRGRDIGNHKINLSIGLVVFFIPDFMGISSLVSAFAEVLNAIRPESERNARGWTNYGREFDVIIGRYEFNV